MYGFISVAYTVFVKSIDKGILEFLGPLGLMNFFRSASSKLSRFQSGLIYHYAFVFLIGLVVALSLFALNLSWLHFIESGLIFVILVGIAVLITFG